MRSGFNVRGESEEEEVGWALQWRFRFAFTSMEQFQPIIIVLLPSVSELGTCR